MYVEREVACLQPGSQASVQLSGQRGWTSLQGGTTEHGERVFARFEVYVTAERAKHLTHSLYKKSISVLIVDFDGAPYCQAPTVADLAPVTTSPS